MKFLFALLFVYSVSALTSFIEEGQRAKFFELTDNEISVFKVTLPDEEYKDLIRKCQYANPYLDMDWNNFNGDKFEVKPNESEPFKTKNATLSVEINGEEKSFKKVTFSLGGSSARSRGRQAFNLKIRGNKDLYGRSQFRLRSDANDATTIRSKLSCDMHNRLGLVSISANYISLYINNEYMGLFVIMDAPKVSWAKLAYNDENTKNLYKCKEALSDLSLATSVTGCVNENDEITENPEWIEFLTALDNAQSAEEIEDFFDIDQFLYEIAYEYLSGSCDHYLFNGHNFNVYKMKNGKWTMISYDFDADLGQNVHYVGIYPHSTNSTDYASYSFDEWISLNQHLVDILILKDRTRFETILKNFVTKAFNPTVLFPHIDKIKELIRPEKIREKTPDENGNLPGFINKKGTMDYSLEQWDANCEFTTVSDNFMSTGHGLKYWILMKYRYVCKAYDIECDPTYMDENYPIPINKNVEAFFVNSFGGFGNGDMNYGDFGNGDMNNLPQETITELTTSTINNPTTVTITSTLTTTTTTDDISATATSINDDDIEVEVESDINDIDDESDSDSDDNEN